MGFHVFSKGEHYSKETASPAKETYSIIWIHHRCGYTERQCPLTNILIGDMSDLKVSKAHALENSSFPLLPDIPDHIQQSSNAERLVFLSTPTIMASHQSSTDQCIRGVSA
jgi:hypothetical protein